MTTTTTTRKPRACRVESEPAQPYAAPQAGPLPGINYPRAVTQGFTTARAWEDDVIAKATAILDARCAREGEVLRDPGMAGRLAKLQLQAHEREVFLVMFLDTAHRLIATEALFLGTIGGTEVHPREVIKAALRHNASAVILAHNHPSGNGEPSAADRAVTARIKQSAALVDVRVLDHFVIGTGEPVSMAARGWV